MTLPDDRRVPARSRLDPGRADYHRILELHERAMSCGESRYADPGTGLWVFTAAHLWSRERCCDSGCRHCPYFDPR